MRARAVAATCLALATGLLTLAGCGSTSTSASATGSVDATRGAAPGPAALAAAAGPVTVTLWHGLGGAGGDALNARIADFNAKNTGKIVVKAAFQGSYADTLAKYTAALRDGGTPSILVTNDITTGFVRDAGQTIPAADLAAANPDDLDPASLRPIARNYYTVDGKLLAVPLATSMPLLYLNDDLLAKAGVDRATLKTLDGVAAAARQIKARTGVPGFVQPIDGWWFEQLVAASGQSYCTPGNGRQAGGATALTFAPQSRAAVSTVAKLFLDKTALNTGSDGSKASAAFAAGKVAMMVNSSAAIGALRTAGAKGWSTSPYPLSGDRASSGALIGGAAMWVNAKGHSPAEQVAGWRLISYLASAPAQEAFSQASGYAPVAVAADESPTEKAFLTANPPYETLRTQMVDTPVVAATAGCLSGAMPGIRTEVVQRMQAAFTGATPIDAAFDQAQQAATTKISEYRKLAGQ